MAATPKPIRKEAAKFASKYSKAAKEHPKMPEHHKTNKHIKKIRNFNEKEKKRVLKEDMKHSKTDLSAAHAHMEKHKG
jgi:hypothetical protein